MKVSNGSHGRQAPACCVLLAVMVFVVALSGCRKTPQLGSEESLGAADALWTAVTAKDLKLVDQCEQSLKRLHQDSKLSTEAFGDLEDIIAVARSGDWDEARGDLKTFVRGQLPPQK